MLYRQPVKHKLWWDSELCRSWEFNERSARILNGIVQVTPTKRTPDNDRDHIHKW